MKSKTLIHSRQEQQHKKADRSLFFSPPTGFVVFLLLISMFHSCQTGFRESGEISLIPDPDNGGLTLPEGFSALIVADNLGQGRHIIIRENGDIYMRLLSLNNGAGIVGLRDTTNDGRADIIRYFGTSAGTGIDIHKEYLYASSSQDVFRYLLEEGKLLPGTAPEVIATGFPEQNQRRDKPFVFDKEGNMYVNVGAPSNACMENSSIPRSPGLDPCPQLERQAGIWRFADDLPGQTQEEDGYRYASGIRNSIALEWNDLTEYLYVVQHGRDQLSQLFPDIYTIEDGVNLPAEEFLLVKEGSDFGWPYCYFDDRLGKRVLAPEYGGNGEITGRCVESEDPVLTFPAHLAPNDLLFYTGEQFSPEYHNGAFITFHGSWNRTPDEQMGSFVAFVPFKGAYPSGEWTVFADGFSGKEVVLNPGDAVYQPMGLALGPDGSLYVSDSQKGCIWRIWYNR